MTQFLWGQDKTLYFNFGPSDVLNAVEEAGYKCTGRCLTLNSYENRVYEVEIELPAGVKIQSPRDTRKVVKFYRPGRWTKEQILEEHQFMKDLSDAEVPVVMPELFSDGTTLHTTSQGGIFYTVFPKRGGRMLPELNDEQLRWIGRHLARLHTVGIQRKAVHRPVLSPVTMGEQNRDFLIEGGFLPDSIFDRWVDTVDHICELAKPMFERLPPQRIHGDCHAGNLLWDDSGPFFIDFDDTMNGPPVQDIWLLLPGRDEEGRKALETLLEGYQQLGTFQRSSLRLIEVLRALRYIHFSAWIAHRWEDPVFQHTFSSFGSERYWSEKTTDLQEQLALIQEVHENPHGEWP